MKAVLQFGDVRFLVEGETFRLLCEEVVRCLSPLVPLERRTICLQCSFREYDAAAEEEMQLLRDAGGEAPEPSDTTTTGTAEERRPSLVSSGQGSLLALSEDGGDSPGSGRRARRLRSPSNPAAKTYVFSQETFEAMEGRVRVYEEVAEERLQRLAALGLVDMHGTLLRRPASATSTKGGGGALRILQRRPVPVLTLDPYVSTTASVAPLYDEAGHSMQRRPSLPIPPIVPKDGSGGGDGKSSGRQGPAARAVVDRLTLDSASNSSAPSAPAPANAAEIRTWRTTSERPRLRHIVTRLDPHLVRTATATAPTPIASPSGGGSKDHGGKPFSSSADFVAGPRRPPPAVAATMGRTALGPSTRSDYGLQSYSHYLSEPHAKDHDRRSTSRGPSSAPPRTQAPGTHHHQQQQQQSLTPLKTPGERHTTGPGSAYPPFRALSDSPGSRKDNSRHQHSLPPFHPGEPSADGSAAQTPRHPQPTHAASVPSAGGALGQRQQRASGNAARHRVSRGRENDYLSQHDRTVINNLLSVDDMQPRPVRSAASAGSSVRASTPRSSVAHAATTGGLDLPRLYLPSQSRERQSSLPMEAYMKTVFAATPKQMAE